jgi:hypothetical protein
VLAVHDAIPENELPATFAETGWLNQPSESADRARVTVTEGLDFSTCSGWLVVVRPDGPAIEHEIVVEVSWT